MRWLLCRRGEDETGEQRLCRREQHQALSRDPRPGRTAGADPWPADNDWRDRGMGAAAGDDAASDRGGDAGSRPHGGYRRPTTFAAMSDDIAALLDHLKIPKADLVAHSFGGASAIRAAIQHPDHVRRLVVISSPHAQAGWYPEAREGMSQVSASMAEHMMRTPTGQFSKQWPEPQRFLQFL